VVVDGDWKNQWKRAQCVLRLYATLVLFPCLNFRRSFSKPWFPFYSSGFSLVLGKGHMGHDIAIAPYLLIPPKFVDASMPQSLQCATGGVPSLKEGHVYSKFVLIKGTFFLYPPLNSHLDLISRGLRPWALIYRYPDLPFLFIPIPQQFTPLNGNLSCMNAELSRISLLHSVHLVFTGDSIGAAVVWCFPMLDVVV